MTDSTPTNTPGGMPEGFDLNAMLEQAQQMQSQLVAAQQELAAATVEGTAGGVRVTLDGTGELVAVDLSVGGDLTDLEDSVVAAYRDAKSHVDELAQRALGPLAGGLGGLGGLGV